jgi:hypothetical protein
MAVTNPVVTDDDFDDDDDDATGGDDNDDDKGADKGGKGKGGKGKKADDDDDDDDEEYDKERALSTIRRQRQAEADLKKQLKEIRGELKTLKTKDMPAAEQVTQERDELRTQVSTLEGRLQKQALRTAAVEAATELKFKNPAIAHKLIDADDIEWDDDTPTNINTLLKREAKANPYLVRRGRVQDSDDDDDDGDDGADGGKGRGSRAGGGADINAHIRQMAGRG